MYGIYRGQKDGIKKFDPMWDHVKGGGCFRYGLRSLINPCLNRNRPKQFGLESNYKMFYIKLCDKGVSVCDSKG